jgi:hypothetical protein
MISADVVSVSENGVIQSIIQAGLGASASFRLAIPIIGRKAGGVIISILMDEINLDPVLPIKDKEKAIDSGKYVVVWKQERCQWKLYRDIWNSNALARG